MRIWFDILNTPQVHFLLGIKEALGNNYEFVFSAREFSETAKLLEQKIDDHFETIGGHYGKSYLKKILGLFLRFQKVYQKNIDFDVSISNGSENAIWTAKLKGKKSIAFGDNDTARQWTYGHLVDYAFFPDAIERALLNKQGLKNRKLYLYHGYKEDIYLANYNPNKDFINQLPFNNFVVVRPENIMANYIRNDSVQSITPELLKLLNQKGINVLYLPRYDFDKEYAKGISNIFIPDQPINGLDAAYHSEAVLTGAGTFAREAACLGVPSASFFAGKKLLAVDQQMIKNQQMFFSRNADEIVKYTLKSKKKQMDLGRSKKVQSEVSEKLNEVLNTFK
jgi:predicted glycosyltransferase